MLEVFEDVQKGHCHRQVSREMKERKDSIDEAEQLSSVGAHGEVVDLSQMPGGEVVDTKGNITLKDVAIITPCGDVVVSSLSYEVIFVLFHFYKINFPLTIFVTGLVKKKWP